MFNFLIKPAYAVIENPLLNSNEQVTNPVSFFSNVLRTIITIFFIVGVIYFLWHFIMSAFHMMTTNGDAKKFEEARNGITYAFLGLVITLSVFAVLSFVSTVLGIKMTNFNLTLPTL